MQWNKLLKVQRIRTFRLESPKLRNKKAGTKEVTSKKF